MQPGLVFRWGSTQRAQSTKKPRAGSEVLWERQPKKLWIKKLKLSESKIGYGNLLWIKHKRNNVITKLNLKVGRVTVRAPTSSPVGYSQAQTPVTTMMIKITKLTLCSASAFSKSVSCCGLECRYDRTASAAVNQRSSLSTSDGWWCSVSISASVLAASSAKPTSSTN